MLEKRLILASSSQMRKNLLEQVGVVPERVIFPEIDETSGRNEHPRRVAFRLSRQKFEKVVPMSDPDVVVISADTTVGLRGRNLPKVENREQAEKCLRVLSGRRHYVYTGVTVGVNRRRLTSVVVRSCVTFKRLSDGEVSAYLETMEWTERAAGYAISGIAGVFVKRIEGSYTSILGLPLLETRQLLHRYGINILDKLR